MLFVNVNVCFVKNNFFYMIKFYSDDLALLSILKMEHLYWPMPVQTNDVMVYDKSVEDKEIV